MSETPTTHVMNENSLDASTSKRGPGRPKKVTSTDESKVNQPGHVKIFPEEPEIALPQRDFAHAQPVDVTGRVRAMSHDVHADNLALAAEKMELETNVQYCKAAGIEWLEVSPALLKSFCKGEIPKVGYFIYKDVKLCLAGTAEDIARRDNMNCHQILFPHEGQMKVR